MSTFILNHKAVQKQANENSLTKGRLFQYFSCDQQAAGPS